MKKKKLANRIIVSAIIIFIIMLGINSFLMFYNSKETVQAAVGEQTMSAAKNMLNYMDIEKYEELVNNPEENDIYWELREELNELRGKAGVLYAYTYFVPEEGQKVKFLVDGMPVDDKENAASLGEESGATTYEHLKRAMDKGGYYSDVLSSEYGEFVSGFVPIQNKEGKIIGFLGVDIDASYVKDITSDIAKDVLPSMVGIFLVIILIALVLMFYYINSSLKPLDYLTKSSEQLAEGDLKGAKAVISEVQLKSDNEITAFTKAFSNTIDSLSATFEVVHEKTDNLGQVVMDMNDASGQVGHSSTAIAESMNGIAASSKQQKGSNDEVMLAMNEMAVGIQRLADTTNAMAESSNEMTALVESGVKNSEEVIDQIQNVESSVVRTSEHVREMGEKFTAISEMVGVITSIADQTNLLALNAAIEAARAGEAGKGFAVVADEVRKLAELSRGSADEIHKQLQLFMHIADRALKEMDMSTAEVKAGSLAVATIGEKLSGILLSVEQVNEQVQDDSAVIEQMSASAQQILASTEQMNHLVTNTMERTQHVASSTTVQVEIVERLNAVVKHLEETSREVEKEIEKFTL
ncbi:methyl-accepting chemotaxis protein [Lysinibacillus odysseyi]|uniref:Chemotaxis protein n=1 Tax=Lysinibacillus odysseyi 34hs-1 = NBRC 100172 TaxID=1220589 RepID=A0A0A3IN04_9BACI|nr:methyl-accepting chemotaxis protein [Lysinibacillus odysseyi]KGR86131.1 chemotaxis protein [Lysinibacillus odysseyi 34hs-1 = NBRC 100172]